MVERIGRDRLARAGVLGRPAHVARGDGPRRSHASAISWSAATAGRCAGWSASLIWLGTLTILAAQLLGIAAVLNVVAGFSLLTGCALGALVTVSYFIAGGLLSSAWVNLVQLIVILAGFGIAAPLAIGAAGGWDALAAAQGSAFDPLASTGPASGWRLLFLLGPAFIVSPGLLQKAYGARDEPAVRRGIAWNGAALLVFACAPPLIGVAARALYPDLDKPDLALPTILAGAMPPAVGTLALAAVFSAEVSSADAVLFMLATSASRDLYRGFVRPSASEADVLRVARIAAVAGSLCGVGVAMIYGSVRAAVGVFYAILTVTLFVPVIGGLYVRGASPRGRTGVGAHRHTGPRPRLPGNGRRRLRGAFPRAGRHARERGGVCHRAGGAAVIDPNLRSNSQGAWVAEPGVRYVHPAPGWGSLWELDTRSFYILNKRNLRFSRSPCENSPLLLP